MAKTRIGKLPPRYSFILNPYPEERLSKCPRCRKPTHARKFAFFIHVEGWGPMALGKTCKYCSGCELIIAHQHELEHELAYSFSKFAPDVIGNEYLVIGTIEKKVWQRGLQGHSSELRACLQTSKRGNLMSWQHQEESLMICGRRSKNCSLPYLHPNTADIPARRIASCSTVCCTSFGPAAPGAQCQKSLVPGRLFMIALLNGSEQESSSEYGQSAFTYMMTNAACNGSGNLETEPM